MAGLRGLILLASAGCLPPGDAEESAFDRTLDPPQIVSASVGCDLEAARWRWEVTTTTWAGGAEIAWTEDGAYVERHDGFRSLRQVPNGGRDELRVDLGIVVDFRPASNGSTAFTCAATPSAKLWVTDLDGETSDCVRVGVVADLLDDLEGVPDCPRLYVPPTPGAGDDSGA